jgi:nucleotide-binding universal stress UspA family protein
MVPLDGSPLANLAIEPAAALAARHDALLLLVTVHEVLAPSEALDRADRDAVAAHLETIRAQSADRWRVRSEAVVLDATAPVAERLADFADDRGVDLMVMTTHGRGAAGRAWFGSVADHVVRVTRCPVLLVRKSTSEGRAGFRRILVPLDGSPEAELALGDAGMVDHAQSEILVLRVVVPVIAFAPAPGGGTLLSGPVLEDQRLDAERYAEGVAARLVQAGHHARAIAMVDTSPAAAILEAAEEHRPDLIVMAGTRRSGADRFLLGSVMDKVVRQAHVPVLIRRTFGPEEARRERAPAR